MKKRSRRKIAQGKNKRRRRRRRRGRRKKRRSRRKKEGESSIKVAEEGQEGGRVR